MFRNTEGPTQSSIAIFFSMWMLINAWMSANMNLTSKVA